MRVRDVSVAGWRIYLELQRWRVSCPRCGGVRVEHLHWPAKYRRYSQRFARQGGNFGGICQARHAASGDEEVPLRAAGYLKHWLTDELFARLEC